MDNGLLISAQSFALTLILVASIAGLGTIVWIAQRLVTGKGLN